MGQIVLYEGNGGSQDIIRTYEDRRGQDVRVKPNDEARSAKLLDVRVGAVITIFDDSSGSAEDDFCVIRVKRSLPEYIVGTFERSFDDEYVSVSYARKNGLDGRVSRIRIN